MEWYTRQDLVEMEAELDGYAQCEDRPRNTDLLIKDLMALLVDLHQQTK